MRQKIALTVASIAATATLTIALAAAGFAPSQVAPVNAAPVNAEASAVPTPIVQVDTVYLKPAPTQETITIQQVASAGEHEDEAHEGAEGDD